MDSLSDAKKLLVISSYPARGKIHGRETVGIASYAKNTLNSLLSVNKDLKITVLAEKLSPAASNQYTEDSINVNRVWQRYSLFTFWHLSSEILRNHKDTNTILLELELSMFGSAIQLVPLPIFLFIMKLIGKKVTVVLHQVIPDMNEMSGHINLKKNSSTIVFYNFCIRILYRIILAITIQAIVFDQALKTKLIPFGNQKKIKVIPHGVEVFRDTISKQIAREKLNIRNDQFVVLSFGYLAWYKGTDWLVDALSTTDIKDATGIMGQNEKSARGTRDTFDTRDTLLILAGGPNPNHLDKEFYKKYVQDIEKKCNDSGFLITGFVPEDEISLYYQAADIVVLPYRTLMSASGPLSIALSYKKPFLVSKAMEGIFQTEDIKQILFDLELSKDDLVFSDKENLVQKLVSLKKNRTKLTEIAALSIKLSEIRSWKQVGKMYNDALFFKYDTDKK